MKKHLLILALVLASTVALSLFVYAAGHPLPQLKEPPVSCALPQPLFTEYGCTVKQTMPGYHPQSGTPESSPVFLPLSPGRSICRAYYLDGLTNGTVTCCPVQDVRHD